MPKPKIELSPDVLDALRRSAEDNFRSVEDEIRFMYYQVHGKRIGKATASKGAKKGSVRLSLTTRSSISAKTLLGCYGCAEKSRTIDGHNVHAATNGMDLDQVRGALSNLAGAGYLQRVDHTNPTEYQLTKKGLDACDRITKPDKGAKRSSSGELKVPKYGGYESGNTLTKPNKKEQGGAA